MEIEEQPKPSRIFLVSLGIISIVLVGLVASELVFRLQPGLGSVCTGNCSIPVGTVVTMPSGVGGNQQLNFAPDTITVVIGINNTVTWKNLDTSPHTVTAVGGAFNSGSIAIGGTWNYTFSTPGTYSYYCQFHNWMKGTVVVKQLAPGNLLSVVTIPSGTGGSQNFNYEPNDFLVIIGVNNTVKFVNADTAVHSVTATGGAFDSGPIAAGSAWVHTFTTPGTYAFHCIYHFWMTGTITVVSPTT